LSAGIDKLFLNTKEFIVKENTLTVNPGTINYQTGEVKEYPLFWYKGEMVKGKNAYLADEKFNLDIDMRGMLINLNPSKISHGNNVNKTDFTQTTEVLEYVGERIKERGIVLPFDETTVSRLDLQNTVQTEHPFFTYLPLFSVLSLNRTVERNYGTGYTYLNQQREFSFYDKIEEQRKKNGKKNGNTAGVSSNLMRAEYRLKKRKPVLKYLGLKTIGNLKNNDVYNELTSAYHGVIKNEVFRNTPQLDVKVYKTEIEKFRAIAQSEHRPIETHLRGLLYTSGEYSIDELKYIWEASGAVSRQSIHSAVRRLLNSYRYQTNIPERINIASLSSELVYKLCS